MGKRKCLICSCAILIIVVLLAAIAVTLVLVLSHRKNPALPEQAPLLDDVISQNATFPNGSYVVQLQTMQPGTLEMAPLNINATQLQLLGVTVDNSSKIAEAGRMSFFYIRLPSLQNHENATKIGNIGVRFGKANTINVVPLSLTSTVNSGLKFKGYLPDRTAVYELQVNRRISSFDNKVSIIQVRMPTTMCTGASSSACSIIEWQPYSVSDDATVGQPGDFATDLPVACGSQCDADSNSPCASSSCQQCDGETVAGTNTPVTRRYNMGQTNGTLLFSYETYTVPDWVKVYYEDQTILDSSCIGTEGEVVQPISFNGRSTELRVDVQPNCDGTDNTGWYFKLPCLKEPCQSPGNAAPCGFCQAMSMGGSSGISGFKIHAYICCNNCDEEEPTCDGHTYQGGSDYKYCDKCGLVTGGGYQSVVFPCGGCAGQAETEDHCNKNVSTRPGWCWKWRDCMVMHCAQTHHIFLNRNGKSGLHLRKAMKEAMGPLCGDGICDPGEIVSCEQDCCPEINPTICAVTNSASTDCSDECCVKPGCCNALIDAVKKA